MEKIIDKATIQVWNEAFDLALQMTGRSNLETAVLTVGIVWGLGLQDALAAKFDIGKVSGWIAK
jgi:hypothetical protein